MIAEKITQEDLKEFKKCIDCKSEIKTELQKNDTLLILTCKCPDSPIPVHKYNFGKCGYGYYTAK